ncbi:toxin-antitoxin system HicB family antitoxin [Erythrobacter ani]|uniref:Toxin-antitoxin system HicB family antitoxin n=1 Tax=Erythrobacter ani TaxID=2827235 RepID=A0ABS6SK26_9SPHN|nr:toxin-antitoxin system HicB family antitoxin [Erythrobacter ani]MBV7265360.1 toxin-antitoxin system HicB family antitoxin [Erythrobacter ani]
MAAPSQRPGKKPAKKAFALRLDPAVHAAVERLAGAELRSANAQIEMLLREALEARGVDAGRTRPPRRGRPPKSGDGG